MVSNSSDFDEVSIVTLTETVLTWHQLKREREGGERERCPEQERKELDATTKSDSEHEILYLK